MRNNKLELAAAAEAIRRGDLVAFPTETVYGLGANAFNPQAIARIFEVKRRPFFDPLIVHVAELAEIERVVADITPVMAALAREFWPGPLTIVTEKNAAVPDIATSGLATVAVRWPAHPVAQRLIELAGTPIAAPSANRFGKMSPTAAEHVREQLGAEVDIILDGGACAVGVESTILSLTRSRPILLRHGGCPIEDLERVLGKIDIARPNESTPSAPGLLKKHYAPDTPIADLGRHGVEHELKLGLLSFNGSSDSGRYAAVEVLSDSGDLREAAANLFGAMRRLDRAGLDLILAEKFPDHGLGRAINERLQKACATFEPTFRS